MSAIASSDPRFARHPNATPERGNGPRVPSGSQPRARSWLALVARCERRLQALEASLLQQQQELREREAARDEAQAQAADARADEQACAARIDELLSGQMPVRMGEFNAHRQHQEMLRARCVATARHQNEAEQAVAAKTDEIVATRHAQAQQRARAEKYRQCLADLARIAQRRADDALDEEACEAMAARKRINPAKGPGAHLPGRHLRAKGANPGRRGAR